MTAFEIAREAATQQDSPTEAEGGPEAVIQAGEYAIRESGSAWISTESPVEVVE